MFCSPLLNKKYGNLMGKSFPWLTHGWTSLVPITTYTNLPFPLYWSFCTKYLSQHSQSHCPNFKIKNQWKCKMCEKSSREALILFVTFWSSSTKQKGEKRLHREILKTGVLHITKVTVNIIRTGTMEIIKDVSTGIRFWECAVVYVLYMSMVRQSVMRHRIQLFEVFSVNNWETM